VIVLYDPYARNRFVENNQNYFIQINKHLTVYCQRFK